MSRTRRTAALLAVLAMLGSGLIQTAAGAFAAPAGSAGQGGVAGPDYSGREVFKIVARMPGPRHATVQARGAFTAAGHFIRKEAALTFPHGRIIVRRHVASITYGGPNLRTCRFSIVERGTFVVRKGTGSYRGLHESGHFTSRLHGRLKKTGSSQCSSKIVARRTVTFEVGTAS